MWDCNAECSDDGRHVHVCEKGEHIDNRIGISTEEDDWHRCECGKRWHI